MPSSADCCSLAVCLAGPTSAIGHTKSPIATAAGYCVSHDSDGGCSLTKKTSCSQPCPSDTIEGLLNPRMDYLKQMDPCLHSRAAHMLQHQFLSRASRRRADVVCNYLTASHSIFRARDILCGECRLFWSKSGLFPCADSDLNGQPASTGNGLNHENQ